jgi:hypothetical protein
VAYRVLPFTVTIPAGTTKAAPFTQALAMDNWVIERVDLEVPAGPAGLMGFQVYNNGVAWLPYGAGEWIVWDDVRQSWTLEDQPDASGWAIVGYNTGVYDHAVTVRMHVNLPDTSASAPAPPTITVVTSEAPESLVTTL